MADTTTKKETATEALLRQVARQWGGGEHRGAAKRLATGFKGLNEVQQRELIAKADETAPGIAEIANEFIARDAAPSPPK